MTIEDRSARSLLFCSSLRFIYRHRPLLLLDIQTTNDFYVTKKSRTIDRDRVIEFVERQFQVLAQVEGKKYFRRVKKKEESNFSNINNINIGS